MKITDKGLTYILSLGFFQKTDQKNIYHLYSWNDVDFYCGLNPKKFTHNKNNDVFITLSKDQFKSLSNKKSAGSNPSQENSENPTLLNYFSHILLLEPNESNSQTLQTEKYFGENTELNDFSVSLDNPSPFKITFNTKKPFHGYYSPLEPFSENLQKYFHGDLTKVWISAVPIIKEDVYMGCLVGISENKVYGLDVLDLLTDSIDQYLDDAA